MGILVLISNIGTTFSRKYRDNHHLISKPTKYARFLFFEKINSSRVLSVSNLDFVNFDATKETVFIIHGWNSHSFDVMATSIKDAYIQTRDINVIVADWSETASTEYIQAKKAVWPVSRSLANMVNLLVNRKGLNLNKTAFVGFSIGAHIAGVASRILKGRISQITGKSLLSRSRKVLIFTCFLTNYLL